MEIDTNSKLFYNPDFSFLEEGEYEVSQQIEDCNCEADNQRTPNNCKIKCEFCNNKPKKLKLVEDKTQRLLKVHKCLVCDYETKQKGHYNRHMKTHMGLKSHKKIKCDMCNYEASDSSTLKRHKRTHTGEKPYQCQYCSKTFRQQAHWSYHVKTHPSKISINGINIEVLSDLKLNPEKRFVCDICDYRSAYRSDLKYHKRTHTNEKPYECNECGYRTVKSSHLKRHKRKHTNVKLYKCEFCNCYETNFLGALERHTKKCGRDDRSKAETLESCVKCETETES